MQVAKNALKTALRVLIDISDHNPPDPADLETLRKLVPLMADAPVDELACEVIQQAIRRRATVRIRMAKAG